MSSLFNSPSRPSSFLTAYTDGGARGNPGPSGYGVVIKDPVGKTVAQLSEYLGHQTNNFAEYQALIGALEWAVANAQSALRVISDSELMVKQIRGEYKVSNPVLKDLHARARQLIRKLEWFEIQHVLRGKNADADRLANEAMDRGSGKVTTTTAAPPAKKEWRGVVRNGVVELIDGEIPDGTKVIVKKWEY